MKMMQLTRYVYVRKNLGIPGVTCNFLQRTVVSTNRGDSKSKVSNLKKYWFSRYVDYVKNYERILEKNFPRTMNVYRMFSDGTKAFYLDLKRYLAVLKKSTINGTENLTSNELKLNYTMRRDLIKISPLLLISAVPFTNYVIFPLVVYFPRYFLTSHYWTPQQKIDFMILDHKKRLKYNAPLFKCMQAGIPQAKDSLVLQKWNDIIASLGSGSHPNAHDVIHCSELFVKKPYGLYYLKRKHVKTLLGIHGMSFWRPFRKDRLLERGLLIRQMDAAIQTEGGVENMSREALVWALSFRGLNPANLPTEHMREWLQKWLTVSEITSGKTMSLLLHCPILLAYNHPNNWMAIYKKTVNATGSGY